MSSSAQKDFEYSSFAKTLKKESQWKNFTTNVTRKPE